MRILLATLLMLTAAATAHGQSVQRSQAQPPPANKAQPTAPVPVQPQEPAASPLGFWLTEEDKSRVHVFECPGGLCARIIWLKEPNDKRGRPWTDQLNKNVALRGQPIIGLELFNAMRPTANRYVWKGKIYNPEDGDYYDVSFTLTAPDRVAIKGCVFFVCETHIWRRYNGN